MKILIYDIETMAEMFLVGIYNPETGMYVYFEVSAYTHQLDAFIRFTENHQDYHWVQEYVA